MSNLKISKEEYDELLEAKHFADDMVNILDIFLERSDSGLINNGELGSKVGFIIRSLKKKREFRKNNSEKP